MERKKLKQNIVLESNANSLADGAPKSGGCRRHGLGHAQREELAESASEVFEEQLLVVLQARRGFGGRCEVARWLEGGFRRLVSHLVLGHPLVESGILGQGQVAWEHHQSALGVLELARALPGAARVRLLRGPGDLRATKGTRSQAASLRGSSRGAHSQNRRHLFQEAEVLVAEGGLGVGPGPPVSRGVLVAAPECVGARQRHDLLVVEPFSAQRVGVLGWTAERPTPRPDSRPSACYAAAPRLANPSPAHCPPLPMTHIPPCHAPHATDPPSPAPPCHHAPMR